MRLCKWSETERLKRLWSLSPEMDGSGLPGRLRLAFLAVQPRPRRLSLRVTDELLLLDANDSKVAHASREFGEPCQRLDPMRVPLLFSSRLLLIWSVIVPGRLHEVIASLVVSRNLQRQLPCESRCVLYNPYYLLHYAIAEVIPINKVFHLAPEYPRLDAVGEAFACSAVHEVLGYRPEQQRTTIQPHTFVEDRAVIRVYLTQILGLVKLREEAALIEFARWVRDRVDVSVEIFLHYLDRDIDESDPRAHSLFHEFGESVRRDASLHSLSLSQVSVSGYSSIGYDLLSADICHLMVVDEAREGLSREGSARLKLAKWWATRHDVINFDASYLQWLEALQSSDAECYEAVFKRSPEDVAASIGSGF